MSKIKKQLLFLGLFSIFGFISLQIPFSKILGSNISFTLFDFFAPISGAFLGPVFGILSVFAVEIINFYIKATPLTSATVIRLFPTLFAVLYFALASKKKDSKWFLAIPLLCMAVFIANPNGRQAWYYSFFWLIPVFAYFRKNNLYLRSLGSTFTAHAVGGAAWIWAFNLPASVYNTLIPITTAERMLFAAGISASYLVTRKLLQFLISKKFLPKLEFSTS